jgi:uncharacterized protein YecT (DUF1311 family)
MKKLSSLRSCPAGKRISRLWMSRTIVPLALLLMLSASAHAAAPSDLTAAALDKCLNAPSNASTGGQTDCEESAAKAYDQRMNRAYADLLKILPAEARSRLQAAQRAWLAFRDAEAKARSALYETRRGTMYVPMQAASTTSIVRDRALELEANLRVMRIDD